MTFRHRRRPIRCTSNNQARRHIGVVYVHFCDGKMMSSRAILLAVALVVQYICCGVVTLPLMLPVSCFVIERRNPSCGMNRYLQQQSTTTMISETRAADTLLPGGSDGDDNDLDDCLMLGDSDDDYDDAIDDDDDYGGNNEKKEDVDVKLDDEVSQDEIQMKVDEDDDDYDDIDEDNETNESATSSGTIVSDLDASVQAVFQQYMITYEKVKSDNEQSSRTVPKMAIIEGWLREMNSWSIGQYNQLLNEISQIGSIRDTETILYYMIEQQQHGERSRGRRDDMTIKGTLLNDETFYYVFASYQYRNKRQQKKNSSNRHKKNRGIGFKVEQLLAIQDAMSCNNENESNSGNSIQPSVQTLSAVLYVMTLDRYDNKIALRARRIWDRMKQMVTDENVRNDDDGDNTSSLLTSAVLSTLICCSHVPRATATPVDKLSSFTVALDCFNWATNTIPVVATGTDGTVSPQEVQFHEQQSHAYTYFLRACRTLLSETNESKRDAVIEAAFRRACTNGYVTTSVVQAMEEIASDVLILRLLGGFLEDGQDLPNEWSRNCVVGTDRKRAEASASSNQR